MGILSIRASAESGHANSALKPTGLEVVYCGWREVSFLFFYMYIFNFLATPRGMRDLCSPTRDGTCAPCIGSVES